MSLPALLDRVLRDPMRCVGTGRAIGYLGWDVPVELILAAGAMPVQLGELAAAGDAALADRYLENSFSARSRAVAQRWLAGELDGLEAVVFSRSDDSAQRLYYYLCELQRFGECKGPRPVLYDLARIGRATSLAHTVESTRLLAATLGVDATRLDAASGRVASRLRLLEALSKRRESDAVPPGRLAYQIIRAARADWSETFDTSLRDWLASPATTNPRRRVLLVGSVPPDDQLHAAVETDDVLVVGEIDEACFSASSNATGIEAIAHRCYRQTTTVNSLLQSPAEIVKRARALRADGVIVWMLATDTGLAWEAPRIERALRDAHLPTLMLTSQPDALSADALAKIADFRHTLEGA